MCCSHERHCRARRRPIWSWSALAKTTTSPAMGQRDLGCGRRRLKWTADGAHAQQCASERNVFSPVRKSTSNAAPAAERESCGPTRITAERDLDRAAHALDGRDVAAAALSPGITSRPCLACRPCGCPSPVRDRIAQRQSLDRARPSLALLVAVGAGTRRHAQLGVVSIGQLGAARGANI